MHFLILPSLFSIGSGEPQDIKWMALLISFLVVPFFLFKKRQKLFKLDLLSSFLLFLAVLIIFYNSLLLNEPLVSVRHFTLILYCTTFIIISNYSISFNKLFKTLSVSLLSLFLLNIFYNIFMSIPFKHFSQISGFYRNSNHFSLLLCFSLLGLIYNGLETRKKNYALFLILLIAVSSLQSRTYLIVALGLLLYAFTQKYLSLKKFILFFVVTIFINLISYNLFMNYRTVESNYGNRILDELADYKEEGRFKVWKRSLELVGKKPLGFGLGNFAYSFYGLDEEKKRINIYKTPHNEFIRFIYELGILGVVLSLLLIISIFYYFNNFRKRLEKRDIILIDGFLLISFFDFLLQFPLSRAFYFLISIFILSRIRTKVLLEIPAKYLLVTSLLVLFYLLSPYIAERIVLPSTASQKLFCRHWPKSANGCLNQIKSVPPIVGEQLANQSFKYNKENHHYWQALGFMEFQNGKKEIGCERLKQFNKMTSHLVPKMVFFVQQNCN